MNYAVPMVNATLGVAIWYKNTVTVKGVLSGYYKYIVSSYPDFYQVGV